MGNLEPSVQDDNWDFSVLQLNTVLQTVYERTCTQTCFEQNGTEHCISFLLQHIYIYTAYHNNTITQ